MELVHTERTPFFIEESFLKINIHKLRHVQKTSNANASFDFYYLKKPQWSKKYPNIFIQQ